MSNTSRMAARPGSVLVIIGGAAALAICLYNYFTPLTGVTGSLGALIVCAASVALILDGILLMTVTSRGLRTLWLVLGFLGAILTLIAGYFLQSWFLMATMVVVLVGLVIAAATSPNHSSARVYA